jgi:hypothetical protein
MLTFGLRQDITKWSTTPDSFGGYSFGAPVALKGRWEDRVEIFRNPTGEEEASRAVVFLDADVDVNDYIYQGTSVASDPTTVTGAWRVRAFVKTPDLRNAQTERRAYV